MIQQIFGNRVRENRLQKGLSQDELAFATGIDRPQISKIEQGKSNPTLETIEKLANALEIDYHELFTKDLELHPFVKWAGGKTQLLDKLHSHMPVKFNNYFEPFIGGGSFFFNISPSKATINDFNSELMIAYKCIQDNENFKRLKNELLEYEKNHSESFYYQIRELDREPNFLDLPVYERAARMIYLNKSCFNGLYRVNSKGYFNVPSGKKLKVKTFDEENIDALHDFLCNNDITILNTDYEKAVETAKKGDFVYFDPPYDSFDGKESFTAYSKDNFDRNEQKRLANLYKKLNSKGVYLMLSNHNTSFIRELYKDFNIYVVNAKRAINSDSKGRGDVEEVIITNY